MSFISSTLICSLCPVFLIALIQAVNINLFFVRFSICLEHIPVVPYVCWRQYIGSCKGKEGLLFILMSSSWISVDSWHWILSLKLTVPRVSVKLLNGKKCDSGCHTQCKWVWSHLAVKPVLFLLSIWYSSTGDSWALVIPGKAQWNADVIQLWSRNKSGKVYLYIPPTHY